jgi:hypothetical protein
MDGDPRPATRCHCGGYKGGGAFLARSLVACVFSMNPASTIDKTTMFWLLKLLADHSAPDMENVSRGRSPCIATAGTVAVCEPFEHLKVAFLNVSEALCVLGVLNDASSEFDMLKS